MFFDTFNILKHQGRQYIPDIAAPVLPDLFRGRPLLSEASCAEGCKACAEVCPTQAIALDPLRLDLGACVFCKECTWACPEGKIQFSNDYRIATNERERLVVTEGISHPITVRPESVREAIVKCLGRSLKLRQVSAGGDNSTEMELNACSNVNFDMGRWGIDWVASPRHADGLVISGPITENMAGALTLCYEAIPAPKLIILAGTDAISGGIFQGSPTLKRDFLNDKTVDLYVPGNPPHPLTFIHGVLDLLNAKYPARSAK